MRFSLPLLPSLSPSPSPSPSAPLPIYPTHALSLKNKQTKSIDVVKKSLRVSSAQPLQSLLTLRCPEWCLTHIHMLNTLSGRASECSTPLHTTRTHTHTRGHHKSRQAGLLVSLWPPQQLGGGGRAAAPLSFISVLMPSVWSHDSPVKKTMVL